MAGGKFDKLAGKVRPGTYLNFESTRSDTVGTSERGTTIIPLLKPSYGPAGSYIELTNAGPDAAYAKLGYSVYDSDPNRQMLLIRESAGLHPEGRHQGNRKERIRAGADRDGKVRRHPR